MICYGIKDWEKHFENSESRKIKSLTWLPVKNKHDGKGYRRVAAHPKSIQIFCAWHLMIQVASKMPVRGVLRDDDGPLTASDLSYKTGYPEHIFEEAFKVLPDPKIGWLEVTNRDVVPASPETSRHAGIEQNGTEGLPPPFLTQGGLERGSGGKPATEDGGRRTDGSDCVVHGAREIPDEDQAFAMTMTLGAPEDFVRRCYRPWFTQGGKNRNNIECDFLVYVTGRWKNERNEYENGTHQFNRANRNSAGGKLERERLKENLTSKKI